mgnify:CR=1 FL=1
MQARLKRLREQVIVITGASSGIGLVTAREAARRGAKVVAVARNGEALEALCKEIEQGGGQASHVVADVGVEGDVRRIGQEAVARFGRIDTWVNDAGVSTYGKITDVPLEDQRRIFETNYWGVVHGSLVAVEHMRQAGGALINVGSQLSDHGIPLQGPYCASKHAVKGFTDSLRMELDIDQAPISVTLIKPAAIDSAFIAHAGNRMDVEPRLPPPLYAPESVAEAILRAAETPMRDVFVGAVSKLASVSARTMPGAFHKLTTGLMYRLQRGDGPNTNPPTGSLFQHRQDLNERGSAKGAPVFERSLYTKASTGLADVGGAVLAVGLGMAAIAAVTVMRPARGLQGPRFPRLPRLPRSPR